MPKVSVIVPVHNTAEYLDRCLKSILDQTLSDIEIILVENASTDNSLEICNRYALQDARITVLSIDVGDLSTARNHGVKHAHAEYVAFVDSDDYISPDMYESMWGFAVEHDLDLVYSNHEYVYDDKPPKSHYPNTGVFKMMTPKELLIMNFSHRVPICSCTMICRRRHFKNMHFPPFRFFEDRAFTYLLIHASRNVGYIDKAYYHYYQRKGSIVRSMAWDKFYDFASAEKERLEFIQRSGIFSEREKKDVARKVAETFIRKLRHVHMEAETIEHKMKARELNLALELIPEGCSLPMKARIYRKLIDIFY